MARGLAGLGRGLAAACLVAGILAGPAPAHESSHPQSTGIYRIPYANGLEPSITNDHHDHSPEDRIDMGIDFGETVVAAASGIVRAVVDNHGGPDEDPDVHSCQDNDDVPGSCTDYNNYVWIEHPNGEWTKYTHLDTGTVSGNGWDVGDAIDVGDVLGTESDIGFASGPHLHFEVGLPDDPDDATPFDEVGGFMVPDYGVNLVPVICDIGSPHGLFAAGDTYTANPCNHVPPTAAAGGPYDVDEGSSVQLDGTGSSDPEGNILTYLWAPASSLDDAASATPSFAGVDDAVDVPLTLTVYDQIEALSDGDGTTVTVHNVPPSVNTSGASIDEAGEAVVSATFTDPGTLDTHTATIDWGDGTSAPVSVLPAPGGGSINAAHVYGDNGVYEVTVTVTDDDDGVGGDSADVSVANVEPELALDTGDAVSFPGGDYLVVDAGGNLPLSADGSDAGSDDLTFAWNTGAVNTYFNNGIGPEPATPSPFGTFPFLASDSANASYGAPGVEEVAVTLTDDDGGSDTADAGVIVTGTSGRTQGDGWWKHQYSGNGSPHISTATALGYLEIVNAVSSVFSEARAVATMSDVHDVLSPTGSDRRRRAHSALMVAWLEFASGAVAWDASVPLRGGPTDFLDLMSSAEATILNPGATAAELQATEKDLQQVRRAG